MKKDSRYNDRWPFLFNAIVEALNLRACTTQRQEVVSKRPEYDIQTIKKTTRTTHREEAVSK